MREIGPMQCQKWFHFSLGFVITYNKVDPVSLGNVVILDFVPVRLGASQIHRGRVLRQAELGVEVIRLLRRGQVIPT